MGEETRITGEVRSTDGRLLAQWRDLGCPEGMSFFEVACHDTAHGYRRKVQESFSVHLGRRGGFLQRMHRRERFVDATSFMLLRPGDEFELAHPLDCGDVYTEAVLQPEVLADWPQAQHWLLHRSWHGTVDDRLDLEHRELVAAARHGLDRFELSERLCHLIAGLLRLVGGTDSATPGDDVDRAVGRRPATLVAHRRLANQAREVIANDGFRLGLTEVAQRVGCSPHHLSRVFRRATGQHLSGYRNRIRLRSVLDTLAEQGEAACLRTLAAEHGFADQAHLTRTVGQHLGQSPSQLRKALARQQRAL